MESLEDQELLERFFSGDQGCFDELVAKYEKRIFHTALYLTETAEDAEFVLQDVFVELHRKLVEDMGKTPIFDWLLQRTLDVSVEQLITKKREAISLPNHSSNYQSMCQHVESFESNNQTLRTSLQAATRQLPANLKFPFLLRDIQGLSISRVAAILGLNVFETRSRLHQARLRIHEQLSELTHKEVRQVS